MGKETQNITIEETEAFYKVLTDAYTKRFKIRTWFFKKILSHMLEKMQEEPTIYYLMQKVQEHRKHTV